MREVDGRSETQRLLRPAPRGLGEGRIDTGTAGATWTRSRGWALWKAMIALAGYLRTDPERAGEARLAIDEVLDYYERGA